MCGSVLWACLTGEDPLAERRYDLDSVAGVLKLYFRGLENPLFPIDSTNQLLEHARECVCVLKYQISVAMGTQQQLIFCFHHPFRRNKERGRESSSAQNGHLFLSRACHHCHKIPLCLPSSVSSATLCSRYTVNLLKMQKVGLFLLQQKNSQETNVLLSKGMKWPHLLVSCSTLPLHMYMFSWVETCRQNDNMTKSDLTEIQSWDKDKKHQNRQRKNGSGCVRQHNGNKPGWRKYS